MINILDVSMKKAPFFKRFFNICAKDLAILTILLLFLLNLFLCFMVFHLVYENKTLKLITLSQQEKARGLKGDLLYCGETVRQLEGLLEGETVTLKLNNEH